MTKILIFDENIKSYYEDLFEIKISNSNYILNIIEHQKILIY
jgi:hypothetical protein